MHRRSFIGSTAFAGAALAASSRLSFAQDKVDLTFSTWGNPGEQELMQGFVNSINEAHPNLNVEFRGIPTDYNSKILTQLNGGTAPDVFYIDMPLLSAYIDNGSIQDYSSYLTSDVSLSNPDDFAEGLWGVARNDEGQIFGVPVDCNPYMLWFNQTIIEEAGIEKTPAQYYEDGEWNWEKFIEICQALVDAGKWGYVLDAGWDDRYAWTSANGAVPYTDGKFTGHEEPKFVEAVQFLMDNIQNELFTFSGTLPQGAGKDALIQSGQAGFAAYGRWLAPQVRDSEQFTFDIVPFPTNTGNKFEPHPMAAALICMNAATEHPDEAFQFITNWVSRDGQIMRLSGQGNAVPSIAGAEEVVLDDPFPEHRQYLLDMRENGFVTYEDEASISSLNGEINSAFEVMFVNGGNAQDYLADLAENVNTIIDENNS
jgi:multiple sugar transport system substrate-binding protein